MTPAVKNKLLGCLATVVGTVVLYVTLSMGETATWIGLVVCLAGMVFLASKC